MFACSEHWLYGAGSLPVHRDRLPLLPEKFIVFSALCFCFSCCLLLLEGVLLLVLDDEKLLFVEIQ